MEQRKVCIKCGRKRIAERMEMFGTVDGVTHWVCMQKSFGWWNRFHGYNEKCTPLPGSLYMRFRNLVTVLLNSFEQTGDPVDVASIGAAAKGSANPSADKKAKGSDKQGRPKKATG